MGPRGRLLISALVMGLLVVNTGNTASHAASRECGFSRSITGACTLPPPSGTLSRNGVVIDREGTRHARGQRSEADRALEPGPGVATGVARDLIGGRAIGSDCTPVAVCGSLVGRTTTPANPPDSQR